MSSAQATLTDVGKRSGPLVALAIIACATVATGYCIWMLNRGFELTDESYYLLLASQPSASRFYISAQHWVTSWLWQISGSLTAFRAAGLIVLLASATTLASGMIAAAARFELIIDSWDVRAAVVGGCVLCALLYATTINLSPSYNLLAAAGAYCAAGLVLLTAGRPGRPVNAALLLLAGAAIGIEILCKASAGVSTFAILLCWIVLFGGALRQMLVDVAAVVVGAVVMMGIALMAHTTLPDAISALGEGTTLFRLVQAEPILTRLLRYAVGYLQFIAAALVIFAVPLAALVLFGRTGKRLFAVVGLLALSVLLIVGSLNDGQFRLSRSGGFLPGGNGRTESQMAVAFVVTLSAAIATFPRWCANWSVLGLTAGLLALPYSVAMGSGNSLVTQIVVSLASWGGLVALLAFTRLPSVAGRGLVVALSILLATQIVTSGSSPYQMASPLHEQSLEVSIGDLGVVSVDPGTRDFVLDMQAAATACSIQPGMPTLGLYSVPGVALVLQAIPMLSPWLNDKRQADFVLDRVSASELAGVVVALGLDPDGRLPALPTKLADFPTGYHYCGSGAYPFHNRTIQIWRAEMP